MEIWTILNSVFSLFFIILVGVYANKKEIITLQINKALTDILIRISLPFMIISSFVFTYDHIIKLNIIKTFYYSIVTYILMIIISYLFLIPVKQDKKTILHFANVFPNTGYVGFPILYSLYGSEGIIYGSIFNMFFVVFVWTYGIFLFEGGFKRNELKSEIKKVLLNPSIIAVFIGIILMTFNIKLHEAIYSSIKSIGNTTGPLSMLIIGGILSNIKIKKYLKDFTIYYGIFTKLICIPAIIYCISLLLVEKSAAANTVIIMTGMPASAMTSILADNYNKKSEYAAIIVSLTTLFSLITAPILLKIIM